MPAREIRSPAGYFFRAGAGAEEVCENVAALGGQDAGNHFGLVIKPPIGQQLVERRHGAGFRIGRSVNHSRNSRLHDRAGDIGQGSSVTYSVQPFSRQSPSSPAACVMAIISAWAVGSCSVSRELCAAAIIRPSCTITAPTGTSPAASASRA